MGPHSVLGSRVADLVGMEEAEIPWLNALYRLKLWVTLPGYPPPPPRLYWVIASPDWGSGVRGRGILSPRYRLGHQGQLEGSQPSQDLRLGRAFLLWSGCQPLPTSLPVHVRDTQTPSLSRLESPLLGQQQERK